MNLRELFSTSTPDVDQTWHCDPLAIVDDEGVIAFAGRADVEFKPEIGPNQIGYARMLGITPDGWQPRITVKSRYERMDRIPDVRFGTRNGFTLLGEDEDGIGFSWHIDGAADLLLTVKADAESKDCEDVELLEIVDSQGQMLFSGPATLLKVPSALADRTYHLEVAGTDLSLETIEEQRNVNPPRVAYTGTAPDGQSQTWSLGFGAKP